MIGENDMKTAIRYIINNCSNIHIKDIALILCDKTTELIAQEFKNILENIGVNVTLQVLPIASVHGSEPPIYIQDLMLSCNVIFCLTKKSLAHTQARMLANKKGIKFLSMPDYNKSILNNEAFFVKYYDIIERVKRFTAYLTSSKTLEITTSKGTTFFTKIEGRKGNCCPGIVNNEFLLGSPPDIEANIAPIEKSSNGIIVVDASITDDKIGLLKDNVILEIKNGNIVNFISNNKLYLKRLHQLFDNKRNFNIIGEFGVGFNNKAKLCGNMLIDEGVYGCVHFGVGSNYTIGGKNKVQFHLDFVINKATVKLDDFVIIKEGEILYE